MIYQLIFADSEFKHKRRLACKKIDGTIDQLFPWISLEVRDRFERLFAGLPWIKQFQITR